MRPLETYQVLPHKFIVTYLSISLSPSLHHPSLSQYFLHCEHRYMNLSDILLVSSSGARVSWFRVIFPYRGVGRMIITSRMLCFGLGLSPDCPMTVIPGAIVTNHTSNINTGMLILLSLGKTHSRSRGKVEAEEKKGKKKKEKGNQTSVLLREIKKPPQFLAG